MGKNLIQQRRGRHRGRFNVQSHKFRGDIKYGSDKEMHGTVTEIIHDPGRSAPIARLRLPDNKTLQILATEGISVGQTITFTKSRADVEPGNIMPIGIVPEGYLFMILRSPPATAASSSAPAAAARPSSPMTHAARSSGCPPDNSRP